MPRHFVLFFVIYIISISVVCFLLSKSNVSDMHIIYMILLAEGIVSFLAVVLYFNRLRTKILMLFDEFIEDDLSGFSPKQKIETQIENLIGGVSRQAQRTSEFQFAMRTAEVSALQNQINPHFLYNTLDSIRWQAMRANATDVADMIELLSVFFRYSISMKEPIVNIYDECANTKDYFAIQHYRFPDKLNLNINIKDEKILQSKIPKMTLQPIVENAIFHGLEPKDGVGKLDINIDRSETTVFIRISDNGVGMPEEKVNEINKKLDPSYHENGEVKAVAKHGVALININQRIKLFFGEDYGMSIFSTENLGTDVILSLPYSI